MSKHGNNNQQNNNGSNQKEPEHDGYYALKRLAAVLCAFALWGVSAYFSVTGLGFKAPSLFWVGVVLSVGITVIEMVFNEEGLKHGLTIVVAALAAYAYGVYTNVVGVMAAQGLTTLAGVDYFTVAFTIGLGVMLEIVPEAMFTWGVTGMKGKDFLSNLIPEVSFGGKKGSHQNNQGNGGNPGSSQNNNGQGQPQQNNQGGHQP